MRSENEEKAINPRKYLILGFIILLLFVGTVLTSCGGNNMDPEKAMLKFTEIIEDGKLDDYGNLDISLTIYYMSPSVFTAVPLSVDDLIDSTLHNYKIVINGNELGQHIDLLKQINNDALIPVEHEPFINARIYYVFETKKGEKLFDVAMWGEDNCIFFNGIEIEENNVFYDVILPFLPEDAASELGAYIGRDN